MKTLQQNCDNWEQRALHAESKSAILQIAVVHSNFFAEMFLQIYFQ
jgi:hypothetical protein